MVFPTILNVGPADTDPLTEEELSLLLAIPRAANNTPNATLFRLPRGPDPTLGWVDVTCTQVQSIVSRLAFRWDAILSDIMHSRTSGRVSSIGPGTIICILAQPAVSALFHHLAFWALGCTIQYTMLCLGEEVVSSCVRQSGCQIALCSEEDHRTQKVMRQLGINVAVVPKNECASNLAMQEANTLADLDVQWPEPRRPSPAIIVQSSASTGDPKLMSFSLYYYTLGHAWNCKQHLASGRKSASKSHPAKGPFTHPRLVLTPPYWQSFYRALFAHLATATPMAFVHTLDVEELSGAETLSWIENLQAGALIGRTFHLYNMVVLGTHTELLRGLYFISTSGSRVDQQMSDLYEEHGLEVTNILGTSELNRLLYASHAPHNNLRPFPDALPPLVFSISGAKQPAAVNQPGRKVQLWSSLSNSPHLAHLASHGGVPLKLQPYPGEGPCHGELAVNWGDVFYELCVPKPGVGGETELVYQYLGKTNDYLQVTSDAQVLNALEYEAELRALVEPRVAELDEWELDVVQVFGNDLPSTALVVQLQGERTPNSSLMRALQEAVETVNARLGLASPLKVDPYKRMLVVTKHPKSQLTYLGTSIDNASDTSDDELECSNLRLSLTHKQTLRRAKNVRTFGPWLRQLDWS
ncbi:hypothetical protein BDV93DRAFT_514494 [Ceratobasidium sp. AG-I]|nr:hypothetical protein BDV93DRAFT_514494 [Ceratobasidium sp. AG-I]